MAIFNSYFDITRGYHLDHLDLGTWAKIPVLQAPGHMAGWQYFVWDNLGRNAEPVDLVDLVDLVDFKGRTWRLCGTENSGQGGIWMIWMTWMT